MPVPAFRRMSGVLARKLGEGAIWHPFDGDPRPIKAIFNAAYAEVDAAGVPVADRAPTAWVPETTVGREPDTRDRLHVGSVLWSIRSVEPDGNGMCRLDLVR